jgi:hypothetical protein
MVTTKDEKKEKLPSDLCGLSCQIPIILVGATCDEKEDDVPNDPRRLSYQNPIIQVDGHVVFT